MERASMQVAISWVWGWNWRPKALHSLTSGTREYQRNLALNLNQQGNSGWERDVFKDLQHTYTTIFSNHCSVCLFFSPWCLYFWLVVLLNSTFDSAPNLISYLNPTLLRQFIAPHLQWWVSKLACYISSSVRHWWYLGECGDTPPSPLISVT